MPELERREACTWTYQGEELDFWQGTCGSGWCFTEGGPADNEVNFCHRCGGRLTVVVPAEEDETEDNGEE